MSRLRIVSYNIHKGRSAVLSRASLNQLRLGLHGLAPDLLFLQEVQGRNDRLGVLDAQHESLAAALGLQLAYGRNAIRRHSEHGNALLSRFPVLGHENQDISDHRLEQRGLLHVQVQIGDHEVHCFVVHLGLFAFSRTRQAEAMIQRIDELVPAHCPILIAGDFNDWHDNLSAELIRRLQVHEVFATAPRSGGGMPPLRESLAWMRGSLKSAYGTGMERAAAPRLGSGSQALAARPPRTFPAALPWFRLDRIYQRGFAVRNARVLRGKPWTSLSDHAPLLADLELP
ncbi:MAG: endonuclease/exonuclease/phosphatase family protein [Pigmentiphaga sp.]